MSKQKINQYQEGLKVTSYLQDTDENNDIFYRVCIFFTDPVDGEIEVHFNKPDSADLLTIENNEFFIITEEIEEKITNHKEYLQAIRENQ
tara:strand:- start:142 stop:411 length:270 start_codon:yes stop_codon:yes gene_type:complete